VGAGNLGCKPVTCQLFTTTSNLQHTRPYCSVDFLLFTSTCSGLKRKRSRTCPVRLYPLVAFTCLKASHRQTCKLVVFGKVVRPQSSGQLQQAARQGMSSSSEAWRTACFRTRTQTDGKGENVLSGSGSQDPGCAQRLRSSCLSELLLLLCLDCVACAFLVSRLDPPHLAESTRAFCAHLLHAFALHTTAPSHASTAHPAAYLCVLQE
jgi:hypothetical protein